MSASPADRPSATVTGTDPGPIELALAIAAAEPDRAGEVLTRLRSGRVWIPLPAQTAAAGRDGGPGLMTAIRPDGAVSLPTVTYAGAEFVPAFTSAERLREWAGRDPGTGAGSGTSGGAGDVPHLVVAAADLARLLPARLGIAVNPGTGPSVALSPDGVSDLASA